MQHRLAVTTLVFLAGLLAPASAQRVFMTVDGQQDAAPTAGPTTLVLPSGATARVMVWIEDSAPVMQLYFYQIMLPWNAALVSGTGTVGFPDAGCSGSNASCGCPAPVPTGALCPGGTALECCDADSDQRRDQPCLWCACVAGVCVETVKDHVADYAGPFGDCAPDGFTNVHDFVQPTLCFTGQSPCDTINLDGGGTFGSCTLDGFCNKFDAVHQALQAFHSPGCTGVAVDRDRPDFVYAGNPTSFPPWMHGTPDSGFGFLETASNLNLPVTVDGIRYLGEFDLTASPDAVGEFLLSFVPLGLPPQGGTALGGTDGLVPYPIVSFQPLRVFASACTATAPCCDLDGNTIRDDNCAFCACEADCVVTPITYGDMGGAFGACPPDGFVNVHDRNLALQCFAGTTSCDAINIDAGGAFNACPADGFCNIHDANIAISVFADTNTCSCGPNPEAPVETVDHAGLALLTSPRVVRPGERFTLQAILTSPLERLRSYQLESPPAAGTPATCA